jgi:hypothetical protein
MGISDTSIVEALCASGWTQNRHVEIELWVRELEVAGYAMNNTAREVLSSLGGLTIQPIPSELQIYKPAPIRFDPVSLKYGFRLTPWERQLGTTLSPLGECYGDASLFIDNDGRLYANWDAILECLGVDFEDSLSTLLFAKKRGTRIKLLNTF